MSNIELIKQLRDSTGVSFAQCKQAVDEAGGDMDKAIAILKEKGVEVAGKKAGRELKAGIIRAYVHASGTAGAMLELNCESDFVAKNEEFVALAHDIAMQIVATNPVYVRADLISEAEKAEATAKFGAEATAHLKEGTLLDQSFIKDPNETIDSLIKKYIQKFGERIEIGKFIRYSLLDK